MFSNKITARFGLFMAGMASAVVLMLVFSAAPGPAGEGAGAGEKKHHRIVMQFSAKDTLSQEGLVNNLKNLEKGWPDAQVEVVFHGPGLDMMLTKKTRFATELEELNKQGIVMLVCENTMARKKVTKADLLPFAGTVPMGIGEIVEKQEAGWSYLKAGI